MTKRATDNYKHIPLSTAVYGIRLPQSVESYVKQQGTAWLRNVITDAALADLQSAESDILQKA